LSIGYIAKEYSVLPSTVKETATTFDLMVWDVVNTWETYKLNKGKGEMHQPSLETMQEMMKKVKGR
jgi:hypothetical protein